MTLVTVDAVVYVSVDIVVVEIGGVVTAVATRALEYRVVVRIRVARGANTIGVAMVDRELRVGRVRERRTSPGGRGMAGRTGGREELRLCGVAGVGGVVVIGLMAADTGRGQRGVVPVDVAVSAYPGRHDMSSGQGECRVVVIKGGICPDSGVMTEFASRRESGRRVDRIGGTRVVRLMARIAQCAVQSVVVVHVTVDTQARRNRVRSG